MTKRPAKIVDSALRDLDTGRLIVGKRHFDETMHYAIDALYPGVPYDRINFEQGFVDVNGKFLDRHEAWVRAAINGQITRRVPGDESRGGWLYSENIFHE